MVKPVHVDVFFPVPESWGMCTTCEAMMAEAGIASSQHERSLDEFPPDWQADLKRLSSILFILADNFQERVKITVWDPRSLQGMWKSIRHGVHRYPSFIINDHTKISGWDQELLEKHIHETLIRETDI